MKACMEQSERGGYDALLGGKEQMGHHLKCMCTNPHALENKTEEIEFFVWSELQCHWNYRNTVGKFKCLES